MAERRKDPKSSEPDDQLRDFLVGVATDPAALGRFVKDPETSMSEAGLSAEDQAVLRSGNPGAINARLASGPGAGAGGPMMLVVDVAGDQVNVRPLLQFPQLVLQQPPLQLQLQPPLQIQQPPLQLQQPPLQIQQPPLQLLLQQPPPVHIQWPIHPPIWPPPPPIHWPITPPVWPQVHPPVHPPIWPPPPPQIIDWPRPPQLVFQQIHPQLVAPGPFSQ
jgi:hypothetical protein